MPIPKLGVYKLPNGTLFKGPQEIYGIKRWIEEGKPVYEVAFRSNPDHRVRWDHILQFRT